jgi:CubicO group peptidase (beta-lactamase class C family)
MSRFLEAMRDELARLGDRGVFSVAEWHAGRVESLDIIKTNPCQNVYSVAKAFVVTAVGLLVDRGLLSTDEVVTDILADEIPDGCQPAWYKTTMDMLLLHKVGLPSGFLDIDCYDSRNFGEDYLAYTLTYPTPEDYTPEKSTYTDAAFYILSRIVEKRAGEPLDNLLWRELLFPIGCLEAAFSRCPKGHPMGATGLYIRAAEMAKLGSIYLNGGMYGSRRILSEDWVGTVLSRGYELKPKCAGRAYGKGGMRGQMLLVLPEQRRVIAWQGYGSADLTEAAINYKD